MKSDPFEGDTPPRAAPDLDLAGVAIYRALLDGAAQGRLLGQVRAVVRVAPLVRPVTPSGRAMRVRLTSAGRLGWYADRTGYRYIPRHPEGMAWPPIPDEALAVWHRVTGLAAAPDSCLVNYYDGDARMGMHQDRDEADLSWPVVSISLGDEALFRVGGTSRGGRTRSVWLQSGDVAVLAGPARLAYHGIDRLRPGSSRLLAAGGRINLTLRMAG